MKKGSQRSLLGLGVAVAAYLLFGSTELLTSFVEAPTSSSPRVDSRAAGSSGQAQIEAAFESRRSGFMVDLDAVVEKKLPDDNDGSRHQRFILRLSPGRTVLVAHNIDLAPRVPLERGDSIRLRGQYEWNERGGVLHWTHHDPEGSHPEGWIEYEGRRYE